METVTCVVQVTSDAFTPSAAKHIGDLRDWFMTVCNMRHALVVPDRLIVISIISLLLLRTTQLC